MGAAATSFWWSRRLRRRGPRPTASEATTRRPQLNLWLDVWRKHFGSCFLPNFAKKTTSSEYLRELIRKDQDRTRLRSLLLEGATSEPAAQADSAYLDGLRGRVRRHARG